MPLFTDFDPEEGLISPGFEKLGLALPEYAVMAFLSERHIQSFAEAHEGYQAGKFMSLPKNFPVWVVKIGEEEVPGRSTGCRPHGRETLCLRH